MAEVENVFWTYEKLDEEGKIKSIGANYTNDTDGSITGKIVMNVHAYFNENPDYWKAHGWIKHIKYNKPPILGYNPQTQFLTISQRQVDEYTIEDVYHAIEKSEEQLLFEEMLNIADRSGGIVWYNE